MNRAWCQYIILSVCMLLAACGGDEELKTGDASTGFFISLGEISVGADSRAVPSELEKPVAEKFHLKIQNVKTGVVVYDDDYTSDFIQAVTGDYQVTASCGRNAVLALDEPYYEGSASATVESGEITRLNVECKVANSLISVEFGNTELLDKYFSTYGVRVGVGDYSLVIPSTDTSMSVYFPAGRSDVKLHFEAVDMSNQTVKIDLTDGLESSLPLSGGDHAIVKLLPSNLGVVVESVDVKQETVSNTIPIEWLPKPKVTGFEKITYVETEAAPTNAIVSFSGAREIDDIQVTMTINGDNLSSYSKVYTLANISELKEIGVTMPDSYSTEGQFNFSELIGQLQTASGATVTNSFAVKVKANNRWSDEQTFTVEVVKPEFSVSVYPGNIWTKEFTMNSLQEDAVESGIYDTINANMSYQFSTDGNTWTTLGSDLRKFGLSPNTTYYVRGLYRGAVASTVLTLSTYADPELENGNMETWTAEERGYYYNAKSWGDRDKLRVYYPFSGTKYWDTNNDFTTRNRDASTSAFSTVYLYNSFPAVSYTKDARGGTWAAELRNTAAGRGNTSSSKSSYDCNNVPGELFIGEITVTNKTSYGSDSYTITEGREYKSRPTSISFWYKYAPYTTDYFKAYVAIYDADDNIIGEGTLTSGDSKSSYTNAVVKITYSDDYIMSHPAKMYIYFGSSIYSGSELPYTSRSVTTYYENTTRTNTTLSGSVLTIDDISLVYGK